MVALWAAGLAGRRCRASARRYWYSLSLPGKRFDGTAPPVTSAEEDLAQRLQRHVVAIASEPHNVAHYAALENPPPISRPS